MYQSAKFNPYGCWRSAILAVAGRQAMTMERHQRIGFKG
jgi:hypothetical protein